MCVVVERKLREDVARQADRVAADFQQWPGVTIDDDGDVDVQLKQNLRQEQGAWRSVGFGGYAVVYDGAEAGNDPHRTCVPGQIEGGGAQPSGIEWLARAAVIGQTAAAGIAMNEVFERGPVEDGIPRGDSL